MKKLLLLLYSLLFITACGGGDDAGGGSGPSASSEYLNVSDVDIPGANTSATMSIQASANCEWSIAWSDSWVRSVSPAKGRGGQSVTITVDVNPSTTASRTALLTITNSNGSITRKVSVSQSASAERLTISGATEGKLTFPSNSTGKEYKITVSSSLSASTKLYGFYIPSRKIFGDKIQAVRHVFTPSVSFSYAPDFSSSRYGFWDVYQKTDKDGNVSMVEYNMFQGTVFGGPGKGKTGSISMDISNNIEMKIKSDDDSTGFKKISIIDELGASMSYNMAADVRPWSDLSTRLRLKLSKSYTFSLNAVFATYAYEADSVGARPYIGNRTEYSYGRFGRFQGMSQNPWYCPSPSVW